MDQKKQTEKSSDTPRPLSQMIAEDVTRLPPGKISVAQIMGLFHERGFGFFLFLLALPMALPLPVPPGVNIALALPLLFLTIQQIVRRPYIWLPQFICTKAIESEKLSHFLLDRASPLIRKIERLIRPRLGFITEGVWSSIIGLAGFIMALSICVPIPLSNTVPSFGIALMALGVLMRDGLAVLIGMALGLIWVVLLFGLIFYFGQEGIVILKQFLTGGLS